MSEPTTRGVGLLLGTGSTHKYAATPNTLNSLVFCFFSQTLGQIVVFLDPLNPPN